MDGFGFYSTFAGNKNAIQKPLPLHTHHTFSCNMQTHRTISYDHQITYSERCRYFNPELVSTKQAQKYLEIIAFFLIHFCVSTYTTTQVSNTDYNNNKHHQNA